MRHVYPSLLAFCALFAPLSLRAQRTVKTLNEGWWFKTAAASEWQAVNLPHTFNLDAYERRDYYMGATLYRRALDLADRKDGRRYFLKVDAAAKAADVVLNGRKLGSHAGGYGAFTFDLTPALKERNVLEIPVDNARRDIGPLSADFTFWGGIYRDVWLVETADRHFNMLNRGSDGVFISTPRVTDDEADLAVRAEVTNDSRDKASLVVLAELFDPQGVKAGTFRQKVNVKPGETMSVSLSGKVKSPRLWSPERPDLYRVTTKLVDGKSGEVLDCLNHTTAFRYYSFSGRKGFSLNGRPYKLRGVNRHQDLTPVGPALEDEAHRRDMQLIKDLGCNFVRLAHYQQDDAVLEACDRLGLMVWEEIPVICSVPDTPGFDDNSEGSLLDMIRQHFNHPSVIGWGYMNEILLHAPSTKSPEWPAFKERTLRLARRLERTLHAEDPGRVSFMAFHQSEGYNETGLNLVDVSGWNLYQGWYVGRLSDFDRYMEDQHARYPDQPVIISEWGAGSDRRLHGRKTKPFDFSIEYQQEYIEHYLPFIEGAEYISGCTYWNFIDFSAAERQESMPRFNNKGLYYNDRTPKDVAFYLKAMWREDIPVVHIATRDYAERRGDSTETQAVKVYTNLPEVELLVNGRSIGRKTVENRHAVFAVRLPYGRSWLTARGVRGGREAQDVTTLTLRPMPRLEMGEELAVNVGSDCSFTSSVTGLTWTADRAYAPGGWGYTGGEMRSATAEIKGTTDGPLYQTWREGLQGYRFDVPQGTYEVELLMADVSHTPSASAFLLGREGEKSEADSRFDVTICGRRVESDFSPADGDRYRRAFRRRYVVECRDGALTVDFTPRKGKAVLSGIKIRKAM